MLSMMSKSLVGIGNQQLGINDSNVNIFFLCVKFLIWESIVPISTCCVCVFLIVIHWFRVTINYNMNKGSRLWTRWGVVI